MLREEQPDIVDVSSPYSCHRDHALAALEAGAHVVCEKPMCWDDSRGLDDILADGKMAVEAAARAGRLLGVSAQYPAVIPTYKAFYEDVRGRWEGVRTLTMEMEVKGRKGPKRHSEIWVDVASHPLSLVIGLLPDGRLDYETAVCEIEERENRARFDYVTAEGRCSVDLVLRDIDEGTPVRRFGVNGFSVDWEGYADESGVYRAMLTADGTEVRCNDFLHTLIERFVAAVRGDGDRAVVTGEEGLLNLEQQVELLRLAQGGKS